MDVSGRRLLRWALGALGAASLALAVAAQAPAQAQDVTDAMSGFATNSDEPVHIEADELEVRDRDRLAVFSGNVVVRQGNTTLRTLSLEIHYTAAAANSGESEPAPDQSISRLEARGGVVVETDDQKATGEWATFEMDTQEITLGGNVVLTQGDNVLRGARLVVHLESGTSRLYSAAPAQGERVQGLFKPGGMRQEQN